MLPRIVQARQYCSRNVDLVKHFPVFNANQRQKASEELEQRIGNREDCYGYHVESQLTSVSLSPKVSANDVYNLMKACQRDIIDYYPEQQKRLTWNAYNTARKLRVMDTGKSHFFNLALEALIFQDIQIEQDKFFSDMEEAKQVPTETTLQKMVHYQCQNLEIEKALELMAKNQFGVTIKLNEYIAQYLIYGHCSRGEYDTAENVVQILKDRNVTFNSWVRFSFILGAARHGDVARLKRYLAEGTAPPSVLLKALLSLAGTKQEYLVLNKLNFPDSDSTHIYYSEIRRTVKQLIEKNCHETAEKLVLKATEKSPPSPELYYDSPAVFYISSLLQKEEDPVNIIDKVYSLERVCPHILETSIMLAFDLSFTEPTSRYFSEQIIKIILEERSNVKYLSKIEALTNISFKEKVNSAKTENEVLFVLKNTTDLGLRVTGSHEWRSLLFRLIPRDTDYSLKELYQKLFEVRDKLDIVSKFNGGLYSNSVIWSHIMKYLFSIRTPIAFLAAHRVLRSIGNVPGPKRWFDSLGYALHQLEDVETFVEILQTGYQNCEKRGNGEDYRTLCMALLVTVNVAEKNQTNIDDMMTRLFQQMEEHNLPFHQHISESLRTKLEGKQNVTNALDRIKVIDSLDFKNVRPKTKKVPPKRRKRMHKSVIGSEFE